MLEISSLIVIATIYVIPLCFILYKMCGNLAKLLAASQSTLVAAIGLLPFAGDLFYLVITVLYFLLIVILLKYVALKAIYVFKDIEVSENQLLIKYFRGHRYINAAARLLIVVIIAFHLAFDVFDIKLFVFAILAFIFVFRKVKRKVKKVVEAPVEDSEERPPETAADESKLLVYEWMYCADPLAMERPVRFAGKIYFDDSRYREYQNKEHYDNSPDALGKYVIDGLCPEVSEIAGQIKKQCRNRGFTAYHQAASVMAFQQSLKYVPDEDSKGQGEYIRYPLETLVEKQGDCDCHSICAAAILYSMGYDVVLLRIMFPQADTGHLALAVEGADNIPGNFFDLSGRRYYYCEVTPAEDNSFSYTVGEMPSMPGASITIIPVREKVSRV